ncbi:hypothetical protein J6836_07730 [Providencia sp. R33]|uniref:hypothetical protein n=1 Tax=Providencia sp. R33 TaxID=2828763 RepID=UPI001C5B30C2|nr:hypothetical protein [Providencia sp. R33]QXX84252.1 hypothetical protein J6836_07730 [Providencia sp. R33]
MDYYVHIFKDAQGDYEVHQDGCQYMPLPSNKLYLGNFSVVTQQYWRQKIKDTLQPMVVIGVAGVVIHLKLSNMN